MKRNYEKEINIFKEMLIKRVSNDIILQTLDLFESYNTEEVEEKEDTIETKEEEDNIESKIETLKDEIKIENVLREPVEKEITKVISKNKLRIQNKIKMDLNIISEHFDLFKNLANFYKSLINSNESKGKVFFIYNNEMDEYKVLFPLIDKELLLNINNLVKNSFGKNINKKISNNNKTFKCFIKENKNGFKIILDENGDKELSFYLVSSIYKNYGMIAYHSFNITGLSDDIKNIINNSFMICNNIKIDSNKLVIEFNFNTKVNKMVYPSTIKVSYTKVGKKCTPYRLLFSNSGIGSRLKMFTVSESGIFSDFNSKFNANDYNVFANNNILIVVPKNKNIKNEFIKNFMLNNDVYKVNVTVAKRSTIIEKFVQMRNNMSPIFNSKFEQFSSLLDSAKEGKIQYLSFSIKTTHILEEDSWIFDFNDITVDNLILS